MKRCECNKPLIKGKALKQNMSGMPDFIGGEVVTMSPDGTANLIDCLKCPECGKSWELKDKEVSSE